MTIKTSTKKYPLGITLTVMSVVGFHALTIACFPDVSNDLTDDGSQTQALDQYAEGPGSSVAYQCGGDHLPPAQRYTTGSTFGNLNVEFKEGQNPSLVQTFQKALGAVPLEIGKTMEAFKARIVVTSEAQSLCASATKKYDWSASSAAQTCWIANSSGITLVFNADSKVISESVVRTFTYAFSEYFVPNLPKATSDASILRFVQKWTSGQEDLAQAFISDLKDGGQIASEDLDQLTQRPTFAHDVTAEAFDSYYCSKASQNVMASRFPKTWKVFAGG